MSEPQNKPVDELMKPATPTTAEQVNQEEQVPITMPSSDNNDNQTEQTTATANNNNNNATAELTGDIKTLKDAFPDLDVDVIETILASQGGNLDAAFEVLLGMSDPSYKPEPRQSEGMNQLRQDEEYARRLAREGDAHYPQNNTQQQAEQPLFNFQEELPIIKEKVIEAGTAAKNKIMSLYNQFMAPEQSQQQQGQSSQGGILESGMGNLSLSDNQAPPRQQQPYTTSPPQQQARPTQPTATSGSVDLYEWDGNKAPQSPVRNPLLQRKESTTSTSAEQLLSDEEFARQLAREDAKVSSHVAASNTITTPPPPPATTTATANTTTAATADVPTTTTSTQNAKSSASSDNEEVTFSALDNESEKAAKPGYTHTTNDDDDLDDLFDKQDSNLDLSVESIDSVDKEAAKTSSKK